MPAPVIQAEELGKAYGGRHLFDNAVFQVEEGDKVAVVGPNGAGKSTLLRILAAREKPDHGVLKLREGVRAHFFDQHPVIPKGATVRDLLAAPAPAPAHLVKEKEELEARIADPVLYETPGFERVLERFSEIEQEIKRATQPPAEAFDSPFVRALGFRAKDLDQAASSLSGGEKTRLFLARTLAPIQNGDLVVLDEPTNHLDVDTIEWLENWIGSFQGTVLVVAHDRVFLDNIAERVFAVGGGKITVFPGNYEDYVALRDEDLERQRRDHNKAVAELKKVEATIQQFRHQKRFDGQYASRMKMMDRRQAVVDRTPDPVLQKVGFGLAFGDVQKSSNEMIRLVGVKKGFGEGTPTLTSVDFEIKKGDRIGVTGPNGAGKSTLLKILTGRLQKDAGTIHVAPGVKGTMLSQEHEDLDASRTLKEEILDARPHIDDEGVKALLGRFAFRPEDDMGRKVGSLSGGERGRMAILKAVLKPSNLLILDEPTNHMDIDSKDVVARALNTYPGTLLVVSHDRFLLDNVTDSTAVVAGGTVSVYPGTFSATRHLHRKATRTVVVNKDRYVVKTKFTDWTANKKYLHGEEHMLAKEELEGSRTLKNALHNGWLEKA